MDGEKQDDKISMLNYGINTLIGVGYKVVIVPSEPKVQLRWLTIGGINNDYPLVSREFLNETNAELLARFGWKTVSMVDEKNGVMYLDERTYDAVKKTLKEKIERDVEKSILYAMNYGRPV
jgi:hypothetical protein